MDQRVPVKEGHEINLLREEFNRMADRLNGHYRELEVKMADKARELNTVNNKLAEVAIADGLTGVYNHRYLQEKLSDEINRAARYGRPLSLVMVDIDHFKRYNETHGYRRGDVVLKEVASCIKSKLRKTDFLGRYGGEEFTLVLPEAEKEDVVALAERIREYIESLRFFGEETQPGRNLTVSLGVAVFPIDAEDHKDLIKKAEGALYKAKENGRNRVEVV